MQRALIEASENLQAAGQVLSLFIDAAIPGDAPFAAVKEKAFSLLDPSDFRWFPDYLRNITFDKTSFEWSYYASLSPTFKRNLRQLFTDLAFAAEWRMRRCWRRSPSCQDLLRQGKSRGRPLCQPFRSR